VTVESGGDPPDGRERQTKAGPESFSSNLPDEALRRPINGLARFEAAA
jgi:hypothetical protein